MGYRLTKCSAIVDMVLQITIFLSHVGILMWNRIQEVKILQESGDLIIYVGIASAVTSFLLDICLLRFILRDCEISLYWWQFTYVALAVPSCFAYIVITIQVGNLALGLWAFIWLYGRVSLLVFIKADYLEIWAKPGSTESYYENLQAAGTGSTSLNSGSPAGTRVEPDAIPPLPSTDCKVYNTSEVTPSKKKGVDSAQEKLTLCSFFGDYSKSELHAISMIDVNQETPEEELQTQF